jgi:putative oxidoreductase
MAFLSIFAAFAARGLLVMLFLPFSALDKVLNFRQAVGQASEAVPNHSLATALIFAGFGIELFMSLAVLTGIADRMAALILAAYCFQGSSRGRELFWDFLKNIALSGGFLAVAFGASANGFQELLAHPLASSHPYSLSKRVTA